MKRNHLGSLLLLPLLAFGSAVAFGGELANVDIKFVHPERFTDFRIQGRETGDSATIFRQEISRSLAPEISKLFPGATLVLTFTNIDLGGRPEPWREPRFHDVRWDRNLATPIRMYFDYAVVDRNKHVIATGSKSLVDADYLYRNQAYSLTGQTDPLFFEQADLRHWVNSLPRAAISAERH